MIIIYTQPTCPRCNILKKKLDLAGLQYDICDDVGAMEDLGIDEVPVMKVNDGELLDYTAALAAIKELTQED